MATPWICIKLGTAASLKIVHVAAWMIGAYLGLHPLPKNCAADCHFVIPKAEFMPGGLFASVMPGSGTPAPVTPMPVTPMPGTPPGISMLGGQGLSPGSSGTGLMPSFLPATESWSPASGGTALAAPPADDPGLSPGDYFLSQGAGLPDSFSAGSRGIGDVVPGEGIAPETVIATTGIAPFTSGAAAGSPVPEPASVTLMIAGLLVLVAVRRDQLRGAPPAGWCAAEPSHQG